MEGSEDGNTTIKHQKYLTMSLSSASASSNNPRKVAWQWHWYNTYGRRLEGVISSAIGLIEQVGGYGINVFWSSIDIVAGSFGGGCVVVTVSATSHNKYYVKKKVKGQMKKVGDIGIFDGKWPTSS